MDYYQRSLLILFLIILISPKLISGIKPEDVLFQQQPEDTTDVLTIFSAGLYGDKINLIWKISEPEKISYFKVEKKLTKNSNIWSMKSLIKKDNFIEKIKDKNEKTLYKYTFTDEPKEDGVHYYQLKAFDFSGEILWTSEEIKIGITAVKDFVLEQNQPNPFNPVTSIRYELLTESDVSLKVYDLIGKEIATLVDRKQSAGKYTVEFNASKYTNITSGIYFYKLETEKHSEVKKMIISK